MHNDGEPPRTVTFVNRFTLKGEPSEFERAFAEIADFMEAQSGILGYTLSQDVENPKEYVNIALWKDAQSLRAAAAHPDFRSHVVALRGLAESRSDLYAERLRYRAEGADTHVQD